MEKNKKENFFYTGRVSTNLLINVLAPERHVLFFSSIGALFQAFIQSFLKVSLVIFEKAFDVCWCGHIGGWCAVLAGAQCVC